MRRHNDTELRVTFFSFQDIMMCVTGIMVIITLLLVMINASEASSPGLAVSQTGVTALTKFNADYAILADHLKHLQEQHLQLSGRLASESGVDPFAMRRELEGLKQRKAGAEKSQVTTDIERDDLQRQLELVRADRQKVEQALAAHEKKFQVAELQSNRLVLHVPPDQTGSPRVIVQVDGNAILIGHLPMELASAVLIGATIEDRLRGLANAITPLTSDGQYVLVLIKPSGFKQYELVMEALFKCVDEGRVGSRPIAESSWVIRTDGASASGGS